MRGSKNASLEIALRFKSQLSKHTMRLLMNGLQQTFIAYHYLLDVNLIH